MDQLRLLSIYSIWLVENDSQVKMARSISSDVPKRKKSNLLSAFFSTTPISKRFTTDTHYYNLKAESQEIAVHMPPKSKKRAASSSTRPRTRATARAEISAEISNLLSSVLPVLVHNGFIDDPGDLGRLEQTCRDASITLSDDDIWEVLFNLTRPNSTLSGTIEVNRAWFQDMEMWIFDSRAWLEAEVARVKSLPAWSRMIHHGVECAICGCNCGSCSGVPIRSEFRYERIEQDPNFVLFLVNPHDNRTVRTDARILCEPCFEQIVQVVEVIDYDNYEQTGKGTLFDAVTNEILFGEGEYDTPTFFKAFEIVSWHEDNFVDADDVAVAIAHALIQPNCNYKHLDISAIHCEHPGLGERGYKALAIALSLNTNLKSISFRKDCEECSEIARDLPNIILDKSNGLFLKAFQYNTNSSMETLIVCPRAFGESTREALEEMMPGLNVDVDSRHVDAAVWGLPQHILQLIMGE